MSGAGETLHATCVAVGDRGLLILGPSGSGKSALALRLVALGALLVSDDRTRVEPRDGRLWASCPNPDLAGLIEARGVGVLRAPAQAAAALDLAVDLGRIEADRLPPRRTVTISGQPLPLVLHARNDHFPEAIMLYLRHGREA
ncbi:HPr kinase/phosphorylase [Tabrizicola flagellatus]|uniref:HPr kinase/phosphorylase n=1 Tax=Tabrizicola flagellatus TaxID=2593021 RepID=UPI0011F1A65D|nr:HPr kinase/phosphatase C-terminal domain-containing protein [Tabrizicola flagellatus]